MPNVIDVGIEVGISQGVVMAYLAGHVKDDITLFHEWEHALSVPNICFGNNDILFQTAYVKWIKPKWGKEGICNGDGCTAANQPVSNRTPNHAQSPGNEDVLPFIFFHSSSNLVYLTKGEPDPHPHHYEICLGIKAQCLFF